MATYDISRLRQALPPELTQVIEDVPGSAFLDAVALKALSPTLTGALFAHFEPVWADVAARWLLPAHEWPTVAAAFSKTLPLAPYLSAFFEKVATTLCPDPRSANCLPILVTLWRLVNFDPAYARFVPASLQTQFLNHESLPIRYVAIRIFCLIHSAADSKLESLLGHYVFADGSQDALMADLDGVETDFAFLTLHEHARCKALHEKVLDLRKLRDTSLPPPSPFVVALTPLVSVWGQSVLPRLEPDGAVRPPTLVKTKTTLENLEALAHHLKNPEPILLRGLPGSGKTSLVREAARELGMEDGLVTLHLNEQTDAKTLIGLYSTGAKPGSFQWRAGILTAAVQEGRWVLIEDLDRAPNEVMSTILPLIERRELLIPSRRETIKASRNFRIFATVRTTLGLNGQETTRLLLGERLWQQLSVRQLPSTELEQVVNESFPSIQPLLPDILSVFDQLTSSMSRKGNSSSVMMGIERPMTLRDLMKWCRRLEHTFSQHRKGNAGTNGRPYFSSDGTLTDTAWMGIFFDALDCFAGSTKSEDARRYLGRHIAEALQIPSEIADHALLKHEPPFQDGDKQIAVGRARLSKSRRLASRISKSKGRPFATTAHARRLLEQIAVAVDLKEPLLLVGETGIGKTTVVQQLAQSLGHKLVVVNLSQQSEVGDLLGGFKPVNTRSLAMPLKEEFEDLFAATGISTEKNEKYLRRISTSIARGKWADVCRLWQQAPTMFTKILEQYEEKQASRSGSATPANGDGQPTTKRRKTESSRLKALRDLKPRWAVFSEKLEQFHMQVSSGSATFAFAFVEGKIVQAVRNGDWLLLDEINLASPDTLESIADLLSSGPGDTPSILLSETGEIDKIEAHSEFRVFGAMNPATDVGKRDLPIGLRSRFTELYVASPDRDVQDLAPIIKTYLKGHAKVNDRIVERVASLYLKIKGLAAEKRIVDGANEVPHYSLRTLTRVLRYVDDVAPYYGLERALLEGFCMGFLTLLSQESEDLVMPEIVDHLFGKITAKQRHNIMSQPPKSPSDGHGYVRFVSKDKDRQYWLMQGTEPPQERSDYIRTAYVERNLLNLVRATSTRRFPVLIQGPTSAGKTSMIEYLANFSGNKFVRINNHEHTDLQEYLGTYVSGADGKLHFQEGVLVQAMRQGHWIVLDELNLAPTDVLEALNRLLDDNRELLIPETQEIVRPHESFMLFATQNPAGLYGGRKVLSRAFRNRFLELHFDDIPESELGYILQMRCRNTAPSDCERIVAVYKELSRLRQTSRVFEQKNSFATLRDLFRWALRDADNRDQIACHGFMLLAERVRDEEERIAVKGVIEKIFKTRIDLEGVYGPGASPALRQLIEAQESSSTPQQQQVVWTKAMRRLFVLVATALRNHEPILLVGETGCGKTTICQIVAEAAARELHIVNAHQNTETGDLIGSQRPVRNRAAIVESLRRDLIEAFGSLQDGNDSMDTAAETSVDVLLEQYKAISAVDKSSKLPSALIERIGRDEARSKALFEWSDGSLVHAMKTGNFFLLDEISLADDSVLERLNSVLEPQRTLLLAEKGVDDASIVAEESFQFLATMNPGGDFGKKELSPALRNRFTEIWVPPLTDNEDVQAIVATTLQRSFRPLAPVIVAFSYWFGRTFRASSATPFSIRDILVWAQFVNRCGQASPPEFALIHGAATVFIDTLGANPSAMVSADPTVAGQQRELCLGKLAELLGIKPAEVSSMYRSEPVIRSTDTQLWVGDFSIERAATGDLADSSFEFDAPTTKMNVMRVVRAMQMNHKPVLLEGNPGVGKTTLISALARACGQPLTRINLSDQTDLMDLFGTDVPVEGAEAGNFAWRDAPFLQAMQRGEWVLLDEMNLASQTVLEGLNACLDHRGEVYIAELDQTFKRHKDFRLFAAQNPHHQGGGRKGLPSSFVNRFIVVYADVFTEADQLRIAHKRFPEVPASIVRSITNFVASLDREVVSKRSFGAQGAPWEFNLRDTLRWLELASASSSATSSPADDPLVRAAGVQDFLDITIRQRFRTGRDRQEVDRLFESAFGSPHEPHSLYHNVSPSTAQVGFALLKRNSVSQPTPNFPGMRVAPRLAEIESLLVCVKHNLPCILVGASGSGKTALLQHVAALAGKPLVVFPLSADVDAMDLVGGFEQADPVREVYASLAGLKDCLERFLLEHSGMEGAPATAEAAAELMGALHLRPQSNQTKAAANDGGEAAFFGRIARCISRLAPLISAESALAPVLSHAYDRLQQPLTLQNPRFEWLDSILVHAAQSGHWLVLDNANLCNASVLDRLNSLLERPNGFLSINEHNGPDGQPRIVTLHPEFRVFLTVDPRHGELSRAMRNRSVEIYLDEEKTPGEARINEISYVQQITPVEARMQRYLDAASHAESSPLWLDNLTLDDASLLQRFLRVIEKGGIIKTSGCEAQARFVQHLRAMQSFVSTPDGEPLRDAIVLQYNEAVQGSPDQTSVLVREQPVHPLQNDPLVHGLLNAASASQPAWWLCVRYELLAALFHAREDLQSQHNRASVNLSKLSLLTRLQRSSLSSQVAIVARDSTSKAYEFLKSVIVLVKLFIVDSKAPLKDVSFEAKDIRYMLNVVWHVWKRTHSLTDQANFDEAKFQAHLGHTRRLLQEVGAFQGATDPLKAFVAQVSQHLEDDFAAGFKLSTGLSINVLWPVLRPLPIPEAGAYRQVVSMERLASRFDNLKWRVPAASTAELGTIMTSIAEAYRLLRVNSTDSASLVQALTDEIAKLEAQVGDDQSGALPIFADVFEAIRQLHVLYGTDSPEQRDVELGTLVLSDLPTLPQLRLHSSLDVAKQLQAVDYLLSQDSSLRPWSEALSGHLLRRCDIIGHSSTLASLRALESELPFVGKVVARSSAPIVSDAVVKLNDALWNLITAVVASHNPGLKEGLHTLFMQASTHPQIGAVKIAEHGLVVIQNGDKSKSLPAQTLIWPGINETFPSAWPDSSLDHLTPIMQHHILPAILALAASNQNSRLRQSLASVAWVQFAVGCIKMYTPDKIFDPYLKWQTEQEFRTTLRDSLAEKSVALRQFEHDFAGQDSVSVRVKLVDEDISVVDASLQAEERQQHTEIYRPTNSGAGNELSRLQKEAFNPVLDVIVKDGLGPAHYRLLFEKSSDALQELQLVQNNVVRLIERLLTSQFTAYQDLAIPVANLLRCLQLGLSLGGSADDSEHEDALWLRTAPFLGGQLAEVDTLPAQAAKKWEFLLYSGVCANVDGGSGAALAFSPEGRHRILESFQFFFEEWKRKLEADRRAEEAKNSLYRFRGSYEDEEEMDEAEFTELFPTYYENEDAEEGTTHKAHTAPSKSKWDLASEVAKIHGDILSPSRPAADVILDFTKAIARKTALENEVAGKQAFSANSTLLPATMLALDDRLQSLQSATTAKDVSGQYNFYTDANLPEARKLVALIHDIQVRFRALQRVDEIGHLQPLADVLVGSDKVLEVGFSEPLAKVIPRVEKLHEFLYEWQFRGYAPRQYSAPALYDRLTATLVSWRKLELSTWSSLFDTEAEKCRKEASAWWFIAYEATVSGPMSILLGADAEGKDCKVLAYHAEQLLKELSSYLSGSIVGQYGARLDLLRQIRSHLALLVLDYPGMAVIHNALQGFISFYARYERKAEEIIKKGREGLQKKMNDVLLMASWRDTNIEALRESARKSHLKLFRIVRKYRAVLGQPMGTMILQSLPDQEDEELNTENNVAPPSSDAIIDLVRPQAAAKLCQQLVPGWGSDAHTRRLSTVDRIVGLMAKAGSLPKDALDPADLVSEFVGDLRSSMTALRKETPPTLTEENKDTVKHLKTRKVRLFEDTVKTVSHMGFSSNLGTGRLAAQGSLALVFSGFEAMQLPGELDLAGLEYGFHKLLDLAPKFRDALHDHHSDLHRVVARRSVGFLEGILHVALHQRDLLSRSAKGGSALDKHIAYIENLSADITASSDNSSTVGFQSESSHDSHARSLRWLVSVSQVALHLVDVHARLAALDCRPVQAQLQSWIDKLGGLQMQLNKASPYLPTDFITSEALGIWRQIDEEFKAFSSDLDAQIEARPELAYVLSQVKLWTGQKAAGTWQPALSEDGSNSLATFTDDALNLSKKVLDAMQKFSKAVSELPQSTDDASWLVDYNTKLSAALKALHADTVVSSINQCIELLRKVYATTGVSHAAAPALLQVLLPVLQQYASTYRSSLLQLAQLHRSTCQLGYRLSRAFVDLASQGFCSPQEQGEDDNSGQSGKLEEGTGLGEGQGAEDISKDIQPDEDLSELAQNANKEQDKDDDGIEDEKDAIDMGADELEGEMGSVQGEDEEDEDGDKKDQDGDDDDEDEMDDEAGDVDDLDPTAVDEKMWDGEDDAEDDDKEQQGNESKGQKNEEDDKSAAADENAKSQTADEKDAAAGEEGKTEEEEQKNSEDDKKEGDDGEDADDDEAIGEDDEQAGPQQELNRQDQNVDQDDVLELPDDMVIDGEDGDEDDDGDDGLDDLSDLEHEEDGEEDEDLDEKKGEKGGKEDDAEEAMEDEPNPDDVETVDKEEARDEEEEEENGDEEEGDDKGGDDDGMDVDEEAGGEDEAESPPPSKEAHTKQDDQAAPPDVQSGAGAEQDNMASTEEQEQQDSDVQNQNNSAQRDQGEMGQDQADEKNAVSGGEGKVAQERDNEDGPEESSKPEDSEQAERQPFKKLGDVLERWHRTHREIKQAEEKLEPEDKNKSNDDANNEQSADQEFQHLYDDNAEATTQAMGAAEDEEAKPFDDAMAIDDDENQKTRGEEDSKEADLDKHHGNDELDDVADEDTMKDEDADDGGNDSAKKTDAEDDRTGASMRKGAYEDPEEEEDEKMGEADNKDNAEKEDDDDDVEDVEDEEDDDGSQVASQLLSTHLDDSDEDLMPMDEAVRQWANFQTETHALSLALAAQLRLILNPSQATRLSGGFRTGKRLSIRKIIPYIASGYKRDKIWMRRSVPTKRAYQILLCVDDSQSMAEVGKVSVARPSESTTAGPPPNSSPGHLALSSLVMVARSLAMLEAGQVGVLGFGSSVFAAHELLDNGGGGSFAAMGQSDVRGAQVLRRFTFQQKRTDVALLLRETIRQFQEARYSNMASSAGAASADLWQLAIVLSDGLTESRDHERIRPLLREAAESRIMVVFVVLDGSSGGSNNNNKNNGKTKNSSVLDLKVTKFVKDAQGMDRVVIERYLDTFPFPYYLIVHDLADLPSALAGLLRTWFAEVNA